MTQLTITSELRRWIWAQAEAGHLPDDIIGSMRRSGWDDDQAALALQTVLAERSEPIAAERCDGTTSGHADRPGPDLSGGHCAVDIAGHRVDIVVTLQRPCVVVFGRFLTSAECDALVELARPRLLRSETVDTDTGGSEVNAARTSDGMFFSRGESVLIERIEQRIAALLRWPAERGEGLQVLRYRPGAEYRPHHDYFDPDRPGSSAVLQRGGQRVGTLVMYLSSPERGGATTFPEVGLDVAPVKGQAVFFAYDRPHPSTLTLHGGAPVLAGEKWVATKWLRQRRFE